MPKVNDAMLPNVAEGLASRNLVPEKVLKLRPPDKLISPLPAKVNVALEWLTVISSEMVNVRVVLLVMVKSSISVDGAEMVSPLG